MAVQDRLTSSMYQDASGLDKDGVLISASLPGLGRWIRGRVHNAADADDVLQQTLLLGLTHIGQFRGEATVATWLYRIAINVIRDRYRRRGLIDVVYADEQSLDSLTRSDPEQSPLKTIERTEMRAQIRMAVSNLPDAYRAVIEMRDLEEMSLQRTAQLLGISISAAKSRYHRARHVLKLVLTRERRRNRH